MSLESFEASVENIRGEATKVAAEYNKLVKSVSENPNLTPEGKDAEKDALYNEFRPLMKELRAREEKQIELAINNRLTSIEAPAGGFAPNMMQDFRDAQDRAERIEKSDEALRIVQRSIRNNDKVLAHAVLRVAVEQGWSDVIDTFDATKPGTREAVDELSTLARFKDDSLSRTMHYMGVSR